MWILLVLLFLGVLVAKSIHELHKFNYNATIHHLQSLNSVVVQESLKDKQPLIIHNVGIKKYNLTHETLVSQNPGYIVQDGTKQVLLSTLSDKDVVQMVFYKNTKLSKDIGMNQEMETIASPFETKLSCGRQCSISVLKGNNITHLAQNTHDILILYQIQGQCSLYLINPKHKEDIQGKQSHHLKKWSHKITLKPSLLISIPSNWYYFYESTEPVIQCVIESDTYPTWVYNQLR
jgi:hypothetical protein